MQSISSPRPLSVSIFFIDNSNSFYLLCLPKSSDARLPLSENSTTRKLTLSGHPLFLLVQSARESYNVAKDYRTGKEHP